MAIVNMKKIVLAAPQNDRDGILNLLQSKGYVQLIDLKEQLSDSEGFEYFKNTSSLKTESEYNKIKFCYDFLKQYTNIKKGMLSKREEITKEEYDLIEQKILWTEIYKKCKYIDDEINQNKSKKTKAASLLEQLEQWKNLDVDENHLSKLKKTYFFIGTLAKKLESQLIDEIVNNYEDVYIEKISYIKQDVNLFILCHNEIKDNVGDILKKFGFTRANIDLKISPAKQIQLINEELNSLETEYKKLVQEAMEMSNYSNDIEKVYDFLTSKLEKENAISKLAKTRNTFILQGWIPETYVNSILLDLEKKYNDAFVEFFDPSEDDNPPIVLKNNALYEPFEVITSMYALPLPTEIDPTPVLAPFYLIFFGMMAGDIGYGFVLLLATAFALKFMDLEGDSRKIVKLLFYVSIPTIIFGWLFGSFFGDAVKITPLWINPVDDPMKVLYISVALGLVHLFTGLGVKAYTLIKSGKILDAVYDVLFWYILLIGLIWLLLGGGTISKMMSVAGALGLLLTQGRANESLAGKFFGGVYGLYGVTSYIGDVLSYSRLLALGLATGLIGSSFNLLVRLLGDGILALILGPIVFVGGHTFNLLIGMLGTFVHTCRLEYLEFFGKFYEGGGKAFNPLKISTKFVKVNTER